MTTKITFLYKNGKTYSVNNVLEYALGDDKHGDKIIVLTRTKLAAVTPPKLTAENTDYISATSITPQFVPTLISEEINATQGELAYMVISNRDAIGVSVIPVTETLSHKALTELVLLGL